MHIHICHHKEGSNQMHMSSSCAGAVSGRLGFVLLVPVAIWACLLYLYTSAPMDSVYVPQDPCRGRYVYVHELPPRFNADILAGCNATEGMWSDMCEQVSNAGLGEPLLPLPDQPAEEALTGASGWYATQQFGLDAIFHGRMLQYECLTNDSSTAAAVFVPFYAGFDFALHLWGYDNETRDAATHDLLRWLVGRPEWRMAGGHDHFLVAGRTTWDFQRNDSFWGTNLLYLEAGKNMTVLVVESTGWRNDMAVPYPTYFHPRTDAQVLGWQARIRSAHRPWLMSFVGAPRPDNPLSIRSEIIAQCGASSTCQQLGCTNGVKQCHAPANIMRLFQSSIFCIQPTGDSYTRRSTFDSMVAGCVPVFFHPASAYQQYTWHLPTDHARYSVFIPEEGVRSGNVSIEETLKSIPAAEVRAMQEEVVKLVPRLVYADPRYKLKTVNDAFDFAVEGVLRKMAEKRNGESLNSDEIPQSSWQERKN